MARARQAAGEIVEPRAPAGPRPPVSFGPATSPEHDLSDDAAYRHLGFDDIDLTAQTAGSADFEGCRFIRATMSTVVLDRATFSDCEVANCDWANLRATRSSMSRVSIEESKLTGLQWVDGVLRDVCFRRCRLDLATFHSTSLKDVAFVDCDLARTDFTGTDLRGTHFVDCDLTAARFADVQAGGTRFTRCQLTGIAGVASLKGAVIAGADYEGLAHALAGALGLRIIDG